MALRVGEQAPDFKAESTQGSIEFYSWLGDSWGILFWFPTDFNAVCMTEIAATARVQREFKKRDIKSLIINTDTLKRHRKCINEITTTLGLDIEFPLVADSQSIVSKLYDVIDLKLSTATTERTLYIVDPQKRIRLTMNYPSSTGRNFYEILRVCDALQLTEEFQVVTPADWYQGQDVLNVAQRTQRQLTEKLLLRTRTADDNSLQ